MAAKGRLPILRYAESAHLQFEEVVVLVQGIAKADHVRRCEPRKGQSDLKWLERRSSGARHACTAAKIYAHTLPDSDQDVAATGDKLMAKDLSRSPGHKMARKTVRKTPSPIEESISQAGRAAEI